MALLGYVDRASAAPGESLEFMVSSDAPGTAQVRMVRVRCGLGGRFGPGEKIDALAGGPVRTCDVEPQPLCAGSYGVVEVGGAREQVSELTIAAWVAPTLFAGERRNPHAQWTYDVDPVSSIGVEGEQGLVVRVCADGPAGYALLLDDTGAAAFRVTDDGGVVRSVTTGMRLPRGAWTLVVGRLAADGELSVLQQSTGPWTSAREQVSCSGPAAPPALGGGHVLLGAIGPGVGCLSGKLDSPTIWHRRLADDELERLVGAASPRAVATRQIWSAWNLGGRIGGEEVADVAGARRHGRLVNRPTRAVTGFNWTPDVEEFRQSPQTYGAIHFHPDDVGDVGWPPTFSWQVPAGTPSGVYAAEVTLGGERELLWFVVRPARAARRAPIVVLLPTLTYLAYANTQLPYPDVEQRPQGFERWTDPRRELIDRTPGIGRSLYDIHSDGSGVCYASLLRPMPDNRPDFVTDFLGAGRHLAADLYLIDWLTECGYEFDVITDHDLHREGVELIDGYRVLLTGSHPEYVTAAMLDALAEHGQRGGNLMYLGGNGFWCVSSLSGERLTVMECRRGMAGSTIWRSAPGEVHHSTTGELGGMWRFHGRSPNALTGVGFTAMGSGSIARPYRREPDSRRPEAAFVFEGVGDDEPIGDFGYANGGAAGDELDRADVGNGTPEDALVLGSARDFPDDYLALAEDILQIRGPSWGDHPFVRADMVLIPRTDRGSVFSVGSISWTASLAHNGYDNNVAQITRNVLERFLEAQ